MRVSNNFKNGMGQNECSTKLHKLFCYMFETICVMRMYAKHARAFSDVMSLTRYTKNARQMPRYVIVSMRAAESITSVQPQTQNEEKKKDNKRRDKKVENKRIAISANDVREYLNHVVRESNTRAGVSIDHY